MPLVVEVQNADIIASLIQLKNEVKAWTGTDIQLTVAGAAEAHLLAKELGEADIGVILTPSRPFPEAWESKRMSVIFIRPHKLGINKLISTRLPGPPLTKESAFTTLLAHGVTVGIGIVEQWSARSTRFDIAWVCVFSAIKYLPHRKIIRLHSRAMARSRRNKLSHLDQSILRSCWESNPLDQTVTWS